MPTDAELVARYLGGEREALAGIYDRYADRVHDLCVAMLGPHDDAADAFQDTFLVASRRLDQLRDHDRLRSWLYAIARNQCRARIRDRARTRPDEDAGIQVAVEVDMTAQIARDELALLVTEAEAGLSERDQEVLDLHLRHELDGDELAAVLGVSTANAYKLVQRVRDRVERSLGVLLVARWGRSDCTELRNLLGADDAEFTPRLRKRLARHVDECPECNRARRALLAPGGVASALPFVAAPPAVLEQVRSLIDPADGSAPTAAPRHQITAWRADGFPVHPPVQRRRRTWWAAAAVAVMIVGFGLLAAEALDPATTDTAATATTASDTTATGAGTTELGDPGGAVAAPSSPTDPEESDDPGTAPTGSGTISDEVAVVEDEAPVTSDGEDGEDPAVATAPTTTRPLDTTSTAPTTTPTTTTSSTRTPTSTSTAPPPSGRPSDTVGPVIASMTTDAGRIGERSCQRIVTTATITVDVTDAASRVTSVVANYTVGGKAMTVSATAGAKTFWQATIGPVADGTVGPDGEDVTVTVVATDGAGNSTTQSMARPILVVAFAPRC